MMSGSEGVQVAYFYINGVKIAFHLTKELIKYAVNLSIMIHNAQLANAKGEVDMKKLLKLSPNISCVKINIEDDNKNNQVKFLKLCEELQIPVSELKGARNTKEAVFFYPELCQNRMTSIQEILNRDAKNNIRNAASESKIISPEASVQTISPEEAIKLLGADCETSEFIPKLVQAHPELGSLTRQFVEELKKNEFEPSTVEELKVVVKETAERAQIKEDEVILEFKKENIIDRIKENEKDTLLVKSDEKNSDITVHLDATKVYRTRNGYAIKLNENHDVKISNFGKNITVMKAKEIFRNKSSAKTQNSKTEQRVKKETRMIENVRKRGAI